MSASKRGRGRPWGLVPALLALALSALACDRPSAQKATIELASCRPDGFAEEVLCGALTRPENPAAPDGRAIDLKIVVLPARASHPMPDPLYVIAGGPGQSASAVAPMLNGLWRQIRRQRDVVFVDQRGTGGSNRLDCEDARADQPIAQRLIRDEATDARLLDECRQALRQKADLAFYGTSLAVDDLEAVRQALGHGQINLWGISYGTRVALAYLGRHGTRVRTVTLDAVVPPDVRVFETMGPNAARALELVFADCARDAACAAAFPDLEARFFALVDRLRREPIQTAIADPRTGQIAEVEITARTFAAIVRNVLYDPDVTALLPLTIAQLEKGDARGFLAQADALTKSTEVAEGMHLSVYCGEEFSRRSSASQAAWRDTAISRGAALFDAQVVESYAKSCANWPRGEVEESLFEPVVSNAPVLILSGALDPVTPPDFGERVKKTLSNARHVVAPGASHGVSARGCAAKVIARFIDKASPAELDTACVEAPGRPAFFLDFAGPKP